MKNTPKVYLVRAGRNGEDEDYALTNNLAIIGFRDVPSLKGKKDYDEVAKLVSEALPGQKPRAVGNFTVRLWDSSDLVEVIYRNYERLPAEIQAELPLKRVWMLVPDEPAE